MNTQEFLFSVMRELASVAAQGAAYEQWPDAFARQEVREVWTDASAPLRKARNRRVTIAQLSAVPVAILRELGFSPWNDSLTMVPLWAYHYIADGEVLTCIDGIQFIKGTDDIDLDVRFGCIAFGFPTPKM